MCGISMIHSKKPLADLPKRIGSMIQAGIHRGPNGQGSVVRGETLAMGHCRLSIIDLSPHAGQPVLSPDGRFYLVFNGEIVNYQEINQMLSYSSRSDTQTLLYAICKKGLDWTLQTVQGMFSFILYDITDQSICMVRDHLGIKPLYYTVTEDGQFVAASEIKQILASGLVDAVLEERALDDYLGYRYVRCPYTFFKNIFQVPPATCIRISPDFTQTFSTYWSLPSLLFEGGLPESDLIDATEHMLKKTQQLWTVSDVEVGSYLSGGVDSSLLSALLVKNGFSRLNTYTIGFPDKETNEFPFAEMVAQAYNTNHHAYEICWDDYTTEWDRLIYYKDGPLGIPNEIPLSIMTSNLSKDVTVVMSGEGADELFGGYGRIFRLPFDYENHFSQKSFFQCFREKYEYVPRILRDQFLNNSRGFRELFDAKIEQEFQNYRNEENIFRFFHSYHIQGLLQRLDITSMQASVESRPPFLDHKLIEFVYTQIPYELKLHWKTPQSAILAKDKFASEYSEILDTPKYILKKVAERYLPQEVIYRKKMGFPMPLQQYFQSMFEQAPFYLDRASWLGQPTAQLLSALDNSAMPGQFLWMFINIQKFIDQFFGKSWRY